MHVVSNLKCLQYNLCLLTILNYIQIYKNYHKSIHCTSVIIGSIKEISFANCVVHTAANAIDRGQSNQLNQTNLNWCARKSMSNTHHSLAPTIILFGVEIEAPLACLNKGRIKRGLFDLNIWMRALRNLWESRTARYANKYCQEPLRRIISAIR